MLARLAKSVLATTLLLNLFVAVTTPAARAATAAQGCLTFGTSGHVSVAGSVDMVFPDDSATCWQDSAVIKAARNEFESFQVVVQNPSNVDVPNVDVSLVNGSLAGPAGSTLGGANITIYREYDGYTVQRSSDLEGPGHRDYYDALIPKVDPYYRETRNAFPTTLKAHRNLTAWVDVLVPAGQAAGDYSGQIQISDGTSTRLVSVMLTVRDFALPTISSLDSAFDMEFGHLCAAMYSQPECSADFTGKTATVASLFSRALLDNRVNVFRSTAYQGNTTYFNTYDAPLINGTNPGWFSPQARQPVAKLADVVLNVFCDDVCIAQWESRAAANPSLRVYFFCDETGQNVNLWNTCYDGWTRDANGNKLVHAYEGVKDAQAAWSAASGGSSTIRIAKTGTWADVDWAADHTLWTTARFDIDALIPVVYQLNQRNQAFPGTRGAYAAFLGQYNTDGRHAVWFYSACNAFGCGMDDNSFLAGPDEGPTLESTEYDWKGWPGYAIDEPPSEQRAAGWLAFAYDVTGEQYWDTVHRLGQAWNKCQPTTFNGDGTVNFTDETHCLFSDGGNGDGTLLYPGTPSSIGTSIAIGGTHPIPIESIRLKRIRDGHEDYEYLKLAAANGLDAKGVVSDLFRSPATDDPADPADTTTFAPMWHADLHQVWADPQQALDAHRQTLADAIAPPNPLRGKIVFTRSVSGQNEVFIANADGSGSAVNLTAGSSVSDAQPSLSPDGTKVAFTRGTSSSAEIYVVDVASHAVTRLTTNSVKDEKAVWSRDGSKIAFVSPHQTRGDDDIWTMNVNNLSSPSGLLDVTQSSTAPDFDPAWKPDGQTIAYASTGPDTTTDIFSRPADGSGTQTNLTSSGGGNDDSPAWSNDGTKIVFDSDRFSGGTRYGILVVPAAGGAQTDLSNFPAGTTYQEYQPVFSGDDTAIAYVYYAGAPTRLYTMNANGTSKGVLAFSTGPDSEPDWIGVTISGFTPTSGTAGTTSVTITGTGFAGATAVRFTGTPASSPTVTDTQITATVPQGATTGPITVVAPAGKATTLTSFTVNTTILPTVTGYSPVAAKQKKPVTILGSGFTGATQVAFSKAGGGTVNATTFTVNDDGHITATVPSLATTGPVFVTTPVGTNSTAPNLKIKPTIKSFTPTSGPVGTTVTITGSAFTGATKVQFNGVNTVFTVNSDTKITATVPAGATTGIIHVFTNGGKAKSKTVFTVT